MTGKKPSWSIFSRVTDVMTTAEAARELRTTAPTVRSLIAKGALTARAVPRGTRFSWRIDSASVGRYIAANGRFDQRAKAATRLERVEAELSELREAGALRPPDADAVAVGHERDDLRATVVILQDALGRMRTVTDLQRQADKERAAVIQHVTAALGAAERADELRRRAIEEYEDAVAAAALRASPPM